MSVREVERALRIWTEVNRYFQAPRISPFVVDRDPTVLYEFVVDATGMVAYLEALLEQEIERERCGPTASADVHTWYMDPSKSLRPSIRLIAKPHGSLAGRSVPPDRAKSRMLEQLFLAVNIAEVGTCDMSVRELLAEQSPFVIEVKSDEIRLDSAALTVAFVYARTVGWPQLESLSFASTWEWLHDDMIYDCDVAKTA